MTTVDGATAPAVRTSGLHHRWDETEALRAVDLAVAGGSFVAVVGASGCGKSTLLRLLAGLEAPTSGSVSIGGAPPAVLRRTKQIGWLAQRPALLPWLSVHENLRLAQRVNPTGAAQPDVGELLELVRLDDVAEALPAQLSGGMAQRAALARTLALAAPVWLMDEPFAALDELTREALAAELVAIWRRLRPTVVWVTHHLAEAVTLADRVVVLSPRPGTVVADIPVDLAHPRDATGGEFQAVVRRARQALRGVEDHAATAAVVGGPT